MTKFILEWNLEFKKRLLIKYINTITKYKQIVVDLEKEIKELEEKYESIE